MRRLPDALFWPLALGLTAALACALAAPVHDVLATRGLLADDDRDFLRVLRRLLLVPMVVVFLWRVQPWRGGLFEPYGLRPPAAGV
ncbi:MAG: hypothetical protein O2894_08230, partial [Planctomycetota bacterium]|nr:hypothetical protein [Planctomycetota bacterium]